MKRTRYHLAIAGLMIIVALGGSACRADEHDHSAETAASSAPTEERARCPVCNMYADVSPEWMARITYADGSQLSFETPHHMLKFYFSPSGENVSDYQKNREHISELTVTDYGTKSEINARQAYYVIGSGVKSIMGDTVVPFKSRADAEAFQKEQGGRILTFEEVTPELVKDLA